MANYRETLGLLLSGLPRKLEQQNSLPRDRLYLHRMKPFSHLGETPGKMFAVQNCMTCV
jgi:hypothetical protein